MAIDRTPSISESRPPLIQFSMVWLVYHKIDESAVIMAARGNLGHSARPLWVISRRSRRKKSCPLYPRKRHQKRHGGMSALGQKRTFPLEPSTDYVAWGRSRDDSLSRLAAKVCQNGPASRSSITQPSRVGQDADISLRTKPARILASTSWRITSPQPKSQTKRLTSRAKRVRLGSPATMSFALSAARPNKRVKRSAVK